MQVLGTPDSGKCAAKDKGVGRETESEGSQRQTSCLTYRNWMPRQSKEGKVAKHFSLPPDEFISWLHTINYVRNICAHHARLWNREIKIVPSVLRFARDKVWISDPAQAKRSKIYYTLCMINYLLQSVNPNSSFSERLKQLISEYSPKISAMGFPENWKSEEIWK